MTGPSTDKDTAIFADKLFEWLADFKVENASERARLVAGSFIREGWTRIAPPAEWPFCPTCNQPHRAAPCGSVTSPGGRGR